MIFHNHADMWKINICYGDENEPQLLNLLLFVTLQIQFVRFITKE